MTTHGPADAGIEVRAQVASLLDDAVARYRETSTAEDLTLLRHRLDEPLRVAIAGKVKAGKSTLLNALVGDRLAPTDAGECTRIVTWYRNGLTYRVVLEPRSGPTVQVPFRRESGALQFDIGGHDPDDIRRLVVEWPCTTLRSMSLIDTPGIVSLATDVSQRAIAFLAPQDRPAEADAVCYLMRHLHAADVHLLESFHDNDESNATPMNAIAVLSRADEIGVGRIDAMQTAQRIARRYRQHPQVRRLCQTVLPIAGLLAQAGATLRQDEHDAIAALAGSDRQVTNRLLRSTDRFVAESDTLTVPSQVRSALLDRLGLFGVRLGVSLVRVGTVRSSNELAAAFLEHSGIDALREALTSQFRDRADLLKARSALTALEHVLRAHPLPQTEDLAMQIERITSRTHAFIESRLLNALRAGNLPLPDAWLPEAERLLGGFGHPPSVRLGLEANAGTSELHVAAAESANRWRQRSEHPMNSPERANAARYVVRSCEGVIAALGD